MKMQRKLRNSQSLMTGPLGKSEFCFPRISTLRFSGNKIHCSTRDQSLSVISVVINDMIISVLTQSLIECVTRYKNFCVGDLLGRLLLNFVSFSHK